jgi:RNA polymerase sigma-70 factor (ECF subfamily)
VISPEERFAALFNRTHRPLLAYAVRRVTDPADAADIVAETFLVAWRRLDEVPPDEQARPWLFGVARRVLANYYRGEHRRHALGERLRTSLREVVPATDDAGTVVEVAMERLSPDDRELLRLVAWEALAREEIAMALQISRATVRVRLHRARRRLLAEMATVESEIPPGCGLLKRPAVSGHVMSGWAASRPGAEEGQ